MRLQVKDFRFRDMELDHTQILALWPWRKEKLMIIINEPSNVDPHVLLDKMIQSGFDG